MITANLGLGHTEILVSGFGGFLELDVLSAVYIEKHGTSMVFVDVTPEPLDEVA
jgi:hypothetical protein